MDACATPGSDTDSDDGFEGDETEEGDDVDHGLNDDVDVGEDEVSVVKDIAAIEKETKEIEEQMAEGENDLRAKEERLQRQIDELHEIFLSGPQPHPSRNKIKQQLFKWKLKFGKNYREAVNLADSLGSGLTQNTTQYFTLMCYAQ